MVFLFGEVDGESFVGQHHAASELLFGFGFKHLVV